MSSTVHIYPSKNYSSVHSDALEHVIAPYQVNAIRRRDDWLHKGMRKSLHLLLLAHENGLPCALVLRSVAGFGFFEGVIDPGESDEEAIKKILLRHLMKHSASDRLEFSISDCLLQLWRPEFDQYLHPLLPPHVSRPKEQLRFILVGLPPRAVFQLPHDVALDAIPLADIARHGPFGPALTALPDLLSRTTLKLLSPQH